MAGASIMMAAVKPGVRCGEITGKPDGGIQTNICAKKGDSGSPLFDQSTNKAYGIESSVASDDTGPCLPPEQQQTFYTPLSEALTAATAAKGRTYELITN
jgi:streptogrisin C